MKIKNRSVLALVVTIITGIGGFGQTPETPSDVVQKRITELENQVRSILDELSALKKKSGEKGTEAKAMPGSDGANSKTPIAENKSQEPAKEKVTVEIGGIRVTPYGTIFFNAFANSGGTNNTDVPMWATSGANNASASLRQTRLGLRFEGARVGAAKLGGVVEADFFGGFPGIGVGENFSVVRLRLANARLDWERTSLTVGQDWMVFAPQNPTSLAAAAIPQLTAAGNNWARLPQVKLERRFGGNLVFQGAVLAPQTGDSSASPTFLLQPNSGANAVMPFFQARLAVNDKNWLGAGKNGTVAISAHYGRSRVLNQEVDSTGVALDWNFPFSKRVGISGEAFWGRNLAGFQAGIFQGYNADWARTNGGQSIAGGVRGIETAGGWLQIGFIPDIAKDRLGIYASVGLDDPRTDDLQSVTPRDWRTRNLAFAVDAIYKFTPQFSVGAEVRSFRTDYFLTGTRRTTHMNLGAAYSF